MGVNQASSLLFHSVLHYFGGNAGGRGGRLLLLFFPPLKTKRCGHQGVNHIYLSHEWEIINHSSQVKSFIYAVGFHFIEERCVRLASATLHFSK